MPCPIDQSARLRDIDEVKYTCSCDSLVSRCHILQNFARVAFTALHPRAIDQRCTLIKSRLTGSPTDRGLFTMLLEPYSRLRKIQKLDGGVAHLMAKIGRERESTKVISVTVIVMTSKHILENIS